uniref:Uncharacterized protein n=1 Tax=Oryza nivara TaxID=4536 RepID=A0A0E0J9D5_ORYNI
MERRAAGIEVVRWCGGGQRASGSEASRGLGKTSPPVQCAVTAAAAAEGNDLMGSGGLRRRRRIGKTLSPAAAVGDDVGSGRRMGTCGRPRWMGKLQRWEDLASRSVRAGGGRGRRREE